MGKGAEFEREMCRKLSLWWTEGRDRDVFWRNRTRATAQSPDARHQLGDIVAVKPEGQAFTGVFNVELKRGYSKPGQEQVDVLSVVDSTGFRDSLLIRFWMQAKTDADLSLRAPLLIFKRDRHKPVACFTASRVSYPWWRIWEEHGTLNYCNLITVSDDARDLLIISLDDFLDWVKPHTIKNLWEHTIGHAKG